MNSNIQDKHCNVELAEHLSILLAFATQPALRASGQPTVPHYHLLSGCQMVPEQISSVLDQCALSFKPQKEPGWDTGHMIHLRDMLKHDAVVKANREGLAAFSANLIRQKEMVIRMMRDQAKQLGEGETFSLSGCITFDCYDVAMLERLLNAMLASWSQNRRFWKMCLRWQKQLDRLIQQGPQSMLPALKFTRLETSGRETGHATLLDVARSTPVPTLDNHAEYMLDGDLATLLKLELKNEPIVKDEDASAKLERIIQELRDSSNQYQQSYGDALHSSNEAYLNEQKKTLLYKAPDDSLLREREQGIKLVIDELLAKFWQSLQPLHASGRALVLANTWPIVSEKSLLQLLSRSHKSSLSPDWWNAIIILGRLICAKQRIRRIQRFVAIQDGFALQRELENSGHEQ
ncbi:hypothetical protein LTR66_017364 [Elasticomyces elasticus]|nr:hypothetical protein LTR66_017364 [Elasticomyces elasticus]